MSSGPKPKIGRPPRSGQRTSYVLTIRLTQSEREAFARAANSSPMSEWAREVLNAAAARKPRRS